MELTLISLKNCPQNTNLLDIFNNAFDTVTILTAGSSFLHSIKKYFNIRLKLVTLSDSQYSFKIGKSYADNLVNLTLKVDEVFKNRQVLAAFLDNV